MTINSKSLYHSNIVFTFSNNAVLAPDNAEFFALFNSDQTKGANFMEDPILKTKVLNLPQLKIQIVWEPTRLIIEDLSREENNSKNITQWAFLVVKKFLDKERVLNFGFNFDVNYRFRDMIGMKEAFLNIVDEKVLEKSDLRDWGCQFTLEKEGGKRQERYFLKITSPLEIMAHINCHFESKEINESRLNSLFDKCYNEIDEVMQNLKL